MRSHTMASGKKLDNKQHVVAKLSRVIRCLRACADETLCYICGEHCVGLSALFFKWNHERRWARNRQQKIFQADSKQHRAY